VGTEEEREEAVSYVSCVEWEEARIAGGELGRAGARLHRHGVGALGASDDFGVIEIKGLDKYPASSQVDLSLKYPRSGESNNSIV
jgi:hypothetical protein